MTDSGACRVLGPYLLESLYRSGVRAGLVEPGAYLHLDVRRAGLLMGLVDGGRMARPDVKHVADLLGYMQRHGVVGYDVVAVEGSGLELRVRPRPKNPRFGVRAAGGVRA